MDWPDSLFPNAGLHVSMVQNFVFLPAKTFTNGFSENATPATRSQTFLRHHSRYISWASVWIFLGLGSLEGRRTS